MRQTNPISGSGRRIRAGTPNPRRGEFCKTNPIGPAEQRSQVLCGASVRENMTGDGPEKTNPISGTGGRCRAGTPNPRRAKPCETNPISATRGPAPEETVRNEAKLGRIGVCRQRPSCGVWLDRRLSAQNEPNFRHSRKMSGGDAQPTKRAKRTQFGPRARKWARTSRVARSGRSAIVQNEPKLGGTGVCGQQRQRQSGRPVSHAGPGADEPHDVFAVSLLLCLPK
jgi:hypothetical protein